MKLKPVEYKDGVLRVFEAPTPLYKLSDKDLDDLQFLCQKQNGRCFVSRIIKPTSYTSYFNEYFVDDISYGKCIKVSELKGLYLIYE